MGRVLDDRSVKITAKVEEQYKQTLAYLGVGGGGLLLFSLFFFFTCCFGGRGGSVINLFPFALADWVTEGHCDQILS